MARLKSEVVPNTAVIGRHAQGRIVSTLEGGYNTTALGRCVVEHLSALVD